MGRALCPTQDRGLCVYGGEYRAGLCSRPGARGRGCADRGLAGVPDSDLRNQWGHPGARRPSGSLTFRRLLLGAGRTSGSSADAAPVSAHRGRAASGDQPELPPLSPLLLRGRTLGLQVPTELLEIVCEGGLEAERFAGDGVVEAQHGGVQSEAR